MDTWIIVVWLMVSLQSAQPASHGMAISYLKEGIPGIPAWVLHFEEQLQRSCASQYVVVPQYVLVSHDSGLAVAVG